MAKVNFKGVNEFVVGEPIDLIVAKVKLFQLVEGIVGEAGQQRSSNLK